MVHSTIVNATTRPIRLLIILSDLSRGGAQAVVYHLIKCIDRSRFDITVLYMDNKETMLPDFQALDIKIVYFCNRGMKSKFVEFSKLIKGLAPDIVHTHIPAGILVIFLFLRLCGVKRVVATYHFVQYDVSLYRRVSEFIAQFFISKYVHVSKNSEERHTRHFGIIGSSKRELIYNGISLNDLSDKINATGRKRIFGNGFHVIGIANFHIQKGYRFSIPALHECIKKYPDIHYHIIGIGIDDTIHEDWAKEYIHEHKLSDRIILHGEQKNVFPLLCASDLFLCPSEKELLPMSLLEAMACGLPIIATRTGGIPEVIGEHGEFGILIESGRCDLIENAVELMYTDTEKRASFAQNALTRIRDFDVSQTMVRYAHIFEDVLDS